MTCDQVTKVVYNIDLCLTQVLVVKKYFKLQVGFVCYISAYVLMNTSTSCFFFIINIYLHKYTSKL